MRRKAYERAQAGWEELATEQLPASYPHDAGYVLRSPLRPTLMPSQIRFVGLADASGLRPVGRRLEASFAEWLRRVRMADVPANNFGLATALANEAKEEETVVVSLVGGVGEFRFTHYNGWLPDHSWHGLAPWGARFELLARTPDAFGRVLDDLAEWMCVPEARGDHRSVLVACPERDIIDGTWWRYATGVKGGPMPILEIGPTPFADEVLRTTGAAAARSPTLWELSSAQSHFFGIADGPAGYVSFADAEGVGWGSGYLDQLDAAALSQQRATLSAEDWPNLDRVFERLDSLVPRMREFYDRAYRSDYWIVHFGFTAELEQLPVEYVIQPA